MIKLSRFTLVVVFLLAAQVASADGFDKWCFSLQLSAASLPEFTGGFSRDPVTVDQSLATGLTLKWEVRSNTLAIDFEVSNLVFHLHTSTAPYGGYYGIYEEEKTVFFTRFGVGVNSRFRSTERYTFLSGLRIYAHIAGEYDNELGYGFGEFSIAPYLRFDRLSKPDSRWFFTGNLQLNLLDIDEVGVKLMPQLNLGMGYRF